MVKINTKKKSNGVEESGVTQREYKEVRHNAALRGNVEPPVVHGNTTVTSGVNMLRDVTRRR